MESRRLAYLLHRDLGVLMSILDKLDAVWAFALKYVKYIVWRNRLLLGPSVSRHRSTTNLFWSLCVRG